MLDRFGMGKRWFVIKTDEQSNREEIVKHIWSALLLGTLLFSGTVLAGDPPPPQSQADVKRVDVRYGLGVTYIGGFQDVADFYLNAYGVDTPVIPIGLSFNTTVQISHGNVIASMPAVGVGPVGFIWATETVSYGGSSGYSSSTWFVDIPITATYGIKFLPHGSVGPYVRGGIAYHIARGDFVDSSSPGAFVAAGVEFLQKRRVSLGVEGAYDNSTVSFKDYYSYLGSSPRSKIKSGAAMLSFRVVF
jgi:hypothetical protein